MKHNITVGYLVHDLNDPSVERRCKMLESGGATVRLAGFYRGPAINETSTARKALVISRTYDSAMAKRAVTTLSKSFYHPALKNHFLDCDIVLARNLEQLAIASSLAKKRPLVYECLDIHRLLLNRTLLGKLIGIIESHLLQKTDLLLTSSPGFVKNHFTSTALKAPIYILENKVVTLHVPAKLEPPIKLEDTLRIGWFGMLRCRRTFDVLKNIAMKSEGRIEILIAGKPSPAELPNFSARVEAAPGMTYVGPYTYADLSELYGQCHLAWAIDWFEAGMNSDWLLPNRIYEAIAHGSVPIVLNNTEVSNWTKSRAVGLTVSRHISPEEAILSLQHKDVHALQAQLSSVSARDVYADDKDAIDLVEQLTCLESK